MICAALCCAAAIGTPPAPASAQTGGGEIGAGYVRATAADLGAGTFGGTGIPAQSPPASTYRWVRGYRELWCVVFAGAPPADANALPMPGPTFGLPLNPGPPVGVPPNTMIVSKYYDMLPDDALIIGEFVQDIGNDASPGSPLVIIPRCIGPTTPELAAPPSAAEIWQETPLPRSVVRASPPGTREWPGITRLGSDFRSDAVAVTTASVELDGYHVDVVATPIAYAWSFGNGTDVVSPDAGAPTRVQYLRRGDYSVTRFVVWEGRATITAFGGSFGDQYLGTVTIPERVPYHVAEIRVFLRTTPGRR